MPGPLSYTATHDVFGCLAYGIGLSEAEQVLATQTVTQKRQYPCEQRSLPIDAHDIMSFLS